MNDNKSHFLKAINDILKDNTSLKLLLNSLPYLKLSFKRLISLIILWIIIYFSYISFFVNYINGVESSKEILNSIYVVIIPIFAIIITGYSIFQALTNGRTLMALMKASDNEKSKFQEYNYFFFSVSMLYLFIIITNFILSIILSGLPKDWYFPYFTSSVNNQIFSILITTYIVFVLNALVEMKSFVYNLYQLFSSHAVASTIDQLKKDD